MNASLALTGQVAGRIESVEPVADIIRNCAAECRQVLADLATRYT
jgi:enoyl-[acyl-carrier protein] reductase II